MGEILLINIGVGTGKDPENEVYIPTLKSINQNSKAFVKIFLFATTESKLYAEEIKKRVEKKEGNIEIFFLRDAYCADTLYEDYLKFISETLNNIVHLNEIIIDITRGTKLMSAMLMLASSKLKFTFIRYISGERKQGTVDSGKEVVLDFSLRRLAFETNLKAAIEFFNIGNFIACKKLASDSLCEIEKYYDKTNKNKEEFEHLIYLADFYSDWSAFRYELALEKYTKISILSNRIEELKNYYPVNEVGFYLKKLNSPINFNWKDKTEKDICYGRECYEYLEYLLSDIIISASRSLKFENFEDAYIRMYRSVELMGQAALFKLGYHSSYVPENDTNVRQYIEKLKKGKSHIPALQKTYFQFSRENSLRFLQDLNSLHYESLKEFSNNNDLMSKRNNGLLIHGYNIVESKENVWQLLERIKKLANEIYPNILNCFKVAESIPSNNRN